MGQYSHGVYGSRTIAAMDAAELDVFRAGLLAERDRLMTEIGEAIVAPGQMTYGSQAAAASQVRTRHRWPNRGRLRIDGRMLS